MGYLGYIRVGVDANWLYVLRKPMIRGDRVWSAHFYQADTDEWRAAGSEIELGNSNEQIQIVEYEPK